MKNTQLEDPEPKRGWPSKKVMAGSSGKVFSLDFLFIEHAHAAEAANRVSHRKPVTGAAPLMLGVMPQKPIYEKINL